MSKTDEKSAINNRKRRKKAYIKRNIIKLGSSFAITFPTDFLQTFEDETDELKGVNVHCYKIDPGSILIKKNEAESEIQILNIDAKSFPLELLEKLLISARKLNVNQINIDYNEKDYERILQILNRFGPPIHSEHKMTVDLSRMYYDYNFPDQIFGMVKNFSKIIENIIDSAKIDQDSKKSIDTFLTSINSSFNEALRVLIIRLRNYYLQNDELSSSEGEPASTNIVNTLGNRVLISHIKNISSYASNLFYYKESEELEKYISIIQKFPDMLQKEIELILGEEIENKINDINDFSNRLKDCIERFTFLSSETSNHTVREATITSIVQFIINAISDILEIILTRWIESSLRVE